MSILSVFFLFATDKAKMMLIFEKILLFLVIHLREGFCNAAGVYS